MTGPRPSPESADVMGHMFEVVYEQLRLVNSHYEKDGGNPVGMPPYRELVGECRDYVDAVVVTYTRGLLGELRHIAEAHL